MELLRQFESLLYTASMWLLFIPKMFIGLVLQPWKIVPHVDAELARPTEERFQGSINPLVYFVLVIVFPAIFAFSAAAANHKAKDDLTAFLGVFAKLSFDFRVEMLSVFLLSFPLGLAFVVNRKNGAEITLEGMRRAYYAQCLCGVSFGFFLFALGILMYVDPTALDADVTPGADTFPAVLLFGWFAYSEVVVIRAMTQESVAYAVRRLFYGLGIGYLIALATEIPLLAATMAGYGNG